MQYENMTETISTNVPDYTDEAPGVIEGDQMVLSDLRVLDLINCGSLTEEPAPPSWPSVRKAFADFKRWQFKMQQEKNIRAAELSFLQWLAPMCMTLEVVFEQSQVAGSRTTLAQTNGEDFGYPIGFCPQVSFLARADLGLLPKSSQVHKAIPDAIARERKAIHASTPAIADVA